MIFVYPFGVPFLYWFLLWRQRHILNGGQREKEKTMSEVKALKEALTKQFDPHREHDGQFRLIMALAAEGFTVGRCRN